MGRSFASLSAMFAGLFLIGFVFSRADRPRGESDPIVASTGMGTVPVRSIEPAAVSVEKVVNEIRGGSPERAIEMIDRLGSKQLAECAQQLLSDEESADREGRFLFESLLVILVDRWARTDFDSAWAMAEGHPEITDHLLEALAVDDPDKATALWVESGLPEPLAAFRTMAATGSAAQALALARTNGLKFSEVQEHIHCGAEDDLQTVVDQLMEFESSAAVDAAMRDVFAVWAHRSPREAWFASQGIKYTLTDEVRRIWTLNDPEAVVAFIEELTPGADGVPLIHATARTWILADARDASRWAMQNFDTRTGEAIVKRHFHDLPYRNAVAIWERLPEALRKTVPVSGKKGEPTVWKRFANAEPQRAEDWAGWYPELAHLLTGDNPVMVAPENPEEVTPIKRASETAGKLALDDPAGALKSIGRFSPEGSDDWASVVSESGVFLSWAKQNPDEALSSFLALDTSHQDKLAPLIFSEWATLDPQHFSALINDRLQPGFARDQAIKALVSHIKSADLEAAREWAQTIDDPKVKESVFQNIGVRF